MYNGMVLAIYINNNIEPKWNTMSGIRHNVLIYTVYNTEEYTYILEAEL